jgi:beta-mannosidase
MLFAREKDITFPNPELHWDVSQEGDLLQVSLTANAFARYVELRLDGADVIFSDNYCDIPACGKIEIHFPLPDGWTLEQVKAALHVRSLADVVPAGSKTQDAIKHMLLGLKPASLITRIIFNFLE